MAGVTADHEQTETLKVEVNVPGHDPRKSSPLFESSRKELLARDGGICWICCRTAEGVGKPHEAHHCYIEWSYANAVDWDIVRRLCTAGEWGFTNVQRAAAQRFDWSTFDPANPYSFVDDMLVNGLILCKEHHTGLDAGIHALDHPHWIAQRILKEGFKFSDFEIVHHEEATTVTVEGASTVVVEQPDPSKTVEVTAVTKPTDPDHLG